MRCSDVSATIAATEERSAGTPPTKWPAYFGLHHDGRYRLRSADAAVPGAAFRFAWEGRASWAESLRWMRTQVVGARPLASMGTHSLRTAPWDREPLPEGLWQATRWRGDADVAASTLATASWPVPGTALQSRVAADLRPAFSEDDWASWFVARFARVAGE